MFLPARRASARSYTASMRSMALSHDRPEAQRSLSNRARLLRRRTRAISGHIVFTMGEPQILDRGYLLRPLEDALAALSWSAVLVAAAVVTYRLT